MPSVLCHRWLSVKKSMQLVKIEWWGAGVVNCLEWGADDLHMVQLMPLPPHKTSSLTSTKSSMVYPFWCQLTQIVLEKRPLNWCFFVMSPILAFVYFISRCYYFKNSVACRPLCLAACRLCSRMLLLDVCLFRHNYKRYSLESRLHFRIHAANDRLKRMTDGSQSSLNWRAFYVFY